MINENIYMERLIISKKEDANLFGNISKALQNKIKTDTKIKKATMLAKEVHVSNALITKYLRRMGIDDWSTLRYIHNNIIDNKFVHDNKKQNIKYIEIANDILKARKILFLGVSSSWYSNNDFANKLARIDKWVVTPINKYEQIGLSKLLSNKDMLIVNSISLQHQWMVDVISKTNAIVLVISGNLNKLNLKCIKYSVSILETTLGSSPTRTFTTSARRKVLKIYDNIYEIIISRSENAQLLKLTAYN